MKINSIAVSAWDALVDLDYNRLAQLPPPPHSSDLLIYIYLRSLILVGRFEMARLAIDEHCAQILLPGLVILLREQLNALQTNEYKETSARIHPLKSEFANHPYFEAEYYFTLGYHAYSLNHHAQAIPLFQRASEKYHTAGLLGHQATVLFHLANSAHTLKQKSLFDRTYDHLKILGEESEVEASHILLQGLPTMATYA